MATDNDGKFIARPPEKNSQGILRDEEAGPTNYNLGHFAQTPKYLQDSANTDRMARFFIADSLSEALVDYYSLKSSDYLVSELRNKGFFDFFLTSISDSSQDRYQLTETMGENFVLYGFNKAPEILTCTGILKNTVEDDWKVQFLDFFKKIGGISSLAKMFNYGSKTNAANNKVKNFISFKYDSYIKRGALLNVSHTLSANSEMDIAFSFTFIVTKTFSFIQTKKEGSVNNTDTEAKIVDGTLNTIRKEFITDAENVLEYKDSKVNPALNNKQMIAAKETLTDEATKGKA